MSGVCKCGKSEFTQAYSNEQISKTRLPLPTFDSYLCVNCQAEIKDHKMSHVCMHCGATFCD